MTFFGYLGVAGILILVFGISKLIQHIGREVFLIGGIVLFAISLFLMKYYGINDFLSVTLILSGISYAIGGGKLPKF